MATTDPLTGIFNRRRFFERLDSEWSRCRRRACAMSILMLDIDEFKQVNDAHGHAVGDSVLRSLVGAAADLLRSEDVFARLGGEEFAVLLPEIAEDGATTVAERLRSHLSQVRVDSPSGTVRCTVSIGVAEARLAKESPDATLKRADDALYQAKAAGRDQVCVG
jgi:diguanylate cyclase (GGDEF)-like protein